MTSTEQAPQISRRQMFSQSPRQWAGIVGRLVELSALSLPPVMYAEQEAERKDPGVMRAEEPGGANPNAQVLEVLRVSKSFHHLPSNVRLFNLGILHPTYGDDVDISSVRPYLKRSDIILLESEQVLNSVNQMLLPRGCFACLRREALNDKKEVYNIDVKCTATNHVYECETARASLVAGIGLALTSFEKLRKSAMTLRTFLRVLGWSAAAVSIASPQYILSPEADLSFTQDGRTVLMLRNVLDIAKNNPGKTITVIAGDAHAKGFEFYLGHPKLFDMKFDLYKDTYLKAISGPPERINQVAT